MGGGAVQLDNVCEPHRGSSPSSSHVVRHARYNARYAHSARSTPLRFSIPALTQPADVVCTTCVDDDDDECLYVARRKSNDVDHVSKKPPPLDTRIVAASVWHAQLALRKQTADSVWVIP